MKTTINLIGMLLVICSCQDKEPNLNTTGITVLVDRSDSFILTPPILDILNLSGIKNNIWEGMDLKFNTISDIDDDTSIFLSFPAQSHLLSSTRPRKRNFDRFILQTEQSYKTINNYGTSTRKNSSVYLTLIKSLNQLASSNYSRKYLIIASDLEENDLINTYDSSTLEMVVKTPNLLLKQLESNMKIGDLSGIKVYIYYKAPNRNSNLRFRLLSKFFKTFLEKHNAKVFIGYSLTPQNL